MTTKSKAIFKLTGVMPKNTTASYFDKKDKDGNSIYLIFLNVGLNKKTQNSYDNTWLNEERSSVAWVTRPIADYRKGSPYNFLIKKNTPVYIFVRTNNSYPEYEEFGLAKTINLTKPNSFDESLIFIFNKNAIISNKKIAPAELLSKNADIRGLEAEVWLRSKLLQGNPELISIDERILTAELTRETISKRAPYDINVNSKFKIEVKAVRNQQEFLISQAEIDNLKEENSRLVLVDVDNEKSNVYKNLDTFKKTGELVRFSYKKK